MPGHIYHLRSDPAYRYTGEGGGKRIFCDVYMEFSVVPVRICKVDKGGLHVFISFK